LRSHTLHMNKTDLRVVDRGVLSRATVDRVCMYIPE